MKTKAQKRNEARKNAEALKAKKKAIRDARPKTDNAPRTKKGKSVVPQSKKKK